MSNLPPGVRTWPIELRFLCEKCDIVFDIPAVWELGALEPIKQIVCPNCDNDDEELMTEF